MRVLSTLGRIVAAGLSLDEVIRAAIDGINTALAPDLVRFFMRDHDALILHERNAGSGELSAGKDSGYRVGECLCGRAAEFGEPQYSQRIQDDPRCTLKHCIEAEMCSFAALPLKGGDRVLGVLGLAFVEEYDFDERAAFLETLAALVATALENALLHDEMKLQRSSLEAQVVERTAELSQIAEDLVESKEHLRQLMAAVPDAIIIVDAETRCLTDFNSETTRLYGYSREELLGKNTLMLSADREKSEAAMEDVLADATVPSKVNIHRRKDGSVFPVEVATTLFNLSGRQMLCGAIRDVSRREQAEEEVRRFRAAADVASYGVGMADIEGRLLYVNAAFAEMHGYTKAELWGRNLSIFHNDDQMERVREINERVLIEGSYVAEEMWHCKKDGSVFPTLMSGSIVKNDTGEPVVLSATAIDITERKQDELRLKDFAETQTVLVREVNHRVKNNLATIISLLHREEERIETEEMAPYQSLLCEMEGRVRGLATVHSLLSESGWQPVELSEVVERVVRGALHAVPADARIDLEVMESSVKVDADQAHHLALVLNELTTNSGKYALAGRDLGKIHVCIEKMADDVLLSFSDDGPGFPDAVLAEKESMKSTGLELVEGIVTRTLRGRVTFNNEEGAIVEILFSPKLGRRDVRNVD